MENKNIDLVRGDGQQAQGEFATQILNNGKINLGNMRPFVN